MRYNYVLFDADGTLFDFLKSERYSFGKMMDVFELEHNSEIYNSYSEINDGYWKMLENGQITKPELLVARFRDLCEKYNLKADPVKMNEVYLKTLGGCSFLMENTMQICKRLFGKVHLYIVTNGEASVQKNRYEHSEISKYFEGVFISGRIGYDKPNKKYFDAVFDSLKLADTNDVIIVGDSLTSDIRGGINAGIDTCYFNPGKKENKSGIIPTYEVNNILDVEKIVEGKK